MNLPFLKRLRSILALVPKHIDKWLELILILRSKNIQKTSLLRIVLNRDVFIINLYSNFQLTLRLNSSFGNKVIRPKSLPSAGGICASKVIPAYWPKSEVYFPV